MYINTVDSAHSTLLEISPFFYAARRKGGGGGVGVVGKELRSFILKEKETDIADNASKCRDPIPRSLEQSSLLLEASIRRRQ